MRSGWGRVRVRVRRRAQVRWSRRPSQSGRLLHGVPADRRRWSPSPRRGPSHGSPCVCACACVALRVCSPTFLGLVLRMVTATNAVELTQSVSQSVFSKQHPLLGIHHSRSFLAACSGRPRAVMGVFGPSEGGRLPPAPAGPVFLSFTAFLAWATSRKVGLAGH